MAGRLVADRDPTLGHCFVVVGPSGKFTLRRENELARPRLLFGRHALDPADVDADCWVVGSRPVGGVVVGSDVAGGFAGCKGDSRRRVVVAVS